MGRKCQCSMPEDMKGSNSMKKQKDSLPGTTAEMMPRKAEDDILHFMEKANYHLTKTNRDRHSVLRLIFFFLLIAKYFRH